MVVLIANDCVSTALATIGNNLSTTTARIRSDLDLVLGHIELAMSVGSQDRNALADDLLV